MAQEHKSRREILDAIKSIPSIRDLLLVQDGHYVYELDLEVIVYGRNYRGKRVGPYVRLLTYDPAEPIITQGDWGGNTLYVLVDGGADVFVRTGDDNNARQIKVAEFTPGTQFGEMSVLAGVPRNATVKAHSAGPAQVIEIQRPALRLLRKLPAFKENLDKTYRSHGRNSTIDSLTAALELTKELAETLKGASVFRTFSKNHVLFTRGAVIDRLYLIKDGWVNRTIDQANRDYLGDGFCFGLEGVMRNSQWPYTATLMGRTEVLEISVDKLRRNVQLREALITKLTRFAPPALGARVEAEPKIRDQLLSSQRDLIDTGLVDANNLLVMDMDLCVRCGNCSLACHKIHGQSRLVRRGIHVTRLRSPKLSDEQSVLSPEVCMHCKDPECLTGCPTGAIGRFEQGQIDINHQTCIGCGDCATQCPYNAIKMVHRRPKDTASAKGLSSRLREIFRLAHYDLPKAVETTEDLVAVKCNLCSDRTTLNPPGAKTKAYSCEENCPTGALARINPREYFSEIGSIEGLFQVDRTHAIGRNIHRKDPPRRWIHVIGVALTIAATALTLMSIQKYGLGERLLGFLNLRWITGLVGLLGIAVVMAYPFRKQMYTKRAGPLRYWMLIHSYFGVIAGIMILLHGGADSGGLLTTALMISYDLVIATGLFGIVCYYVAPRLLTKIEGSPLLIDDLEARRDELHKELAQITASGSNETRKLIEDKIVPRFMSLGRLLSQYYRRGSLEEMISSARGRMAVYGDENLRRLLGQQGLGSALGLAQRIIREPGKEGLLMAGARLGSSDEIKLKRVIETARRDKRLLERAAEAAATLARANGLIYLHRLLKAWLPPHIAVTALMLALMLVHIIQVIYYAA